MEESWNSGAGKDREEERRNRDEKHGLKEAVKKGVQGREGIFRAATGPTASDQHPSARDREAVGERGKMAARLSSEGVLEVHRSALS